MTISKSGCQMKHISGRLINFIQNLTTNTQHRTTIVRKMRQVTGRVLGGRMKNFVYTDCV